MKPIEQMKITINVHNCARCGRDHVQLEFLLFTKMPLLDYVNAWTHWATCPHLGEPILLSVIAEDSADETD